MVTILSPGIVHAPAAYMQVAVYSPADRLQPHRYKADEAYQVGTADQVRE
jgi:pyruvate carboxylase